MLKICEHQTKCISNAHTHWYKNSSTNVELVTVPIKQNNDGDIPILSQNREQGRPNARLNFMTRLPKVENVKMDLSTNRSEGKYQISVPTLTFRPQRRESCRDRCFVTSGLRNYPQMPRTRMQRFQPEHRQ
jgi:hypothetical protein